MDVNPPARDPIQPLNREHGHAQCPHCRERISVDAAECRYCGEPPRPLIETAQKERRGFPASQSPATSTVNTKPTRPRPPEQEVEAAQQILPRVLADMDNVTGYGATDPGEGQRVVTYRSLVKKLTEQGPSKTATEWAIHQLAQQGMLTLRYGRLDTPALFQDGQLVAGGKQLVTRDLQYALVESTAALWEWREARSPRSAGTKSGPISDWGSVYTFGQLLSDVEGSEAAYQANMATAEKQQPFAAIHTRLQAAAFKWQPDPDRQRGIERIQVLCDAEGTGVIAPTLRKLRARICQRRNLTPAQTDGLTLKAAAYILEDLNSKTGNIAPAVKEATLSPEDPAGDATTRSAYTGSSVDLTTADSPSRWARLYGIGVKAFLSRCKEGKIRHKRLSSKSYQVAIDDLPAKHQSRYRRADAAK